MCVSFCQRIRVNLSDQCGSFDTLIAIVNDNLFHMTCVINVITSLGSSKLQVLFNHNFGFVFCTFQILIGCRLIIGVWLKLVKILKVHPFAYPIHLKWCCYTYSSCNTFSIELILTFFLTNRLYSEGMMMIQKEQW